MRDSVDRALSRLGLRPLVWRETLDGALQGDNPERNRWRTLARDQPLVPAGMWDRFPFQQYWDGLFVVGFGRKLDEPLPRKAPAEMRREARKWGIVFDDSSVLTWREVLWEDEAQLVAVQRSLHYQRWDDPGGDWVCRYDYQPLFFEEKRDLVGQPMHHLHIGARKDQRTKRKHVPSACLGLCSMLSWVMHAFPTTVDDHVREKLDAKRSVYVKALEPAIPLLCPRGGFPPPSP